MLKALVLRKKIDEKQEALAALRKQLADFATREAELEQDIDAAETDEEKAAVEEAVNKFDEEKTNVETKISELQDALKALDDELQALEDEKDTENTEDSGTSDESETETKSRKVGMKMYKRFREMNVQERDTFFAQDTVHRFMDEVRDAIAHKRAITNVGLTIPEVMIPMVRQIAYDSSKMLPLVNTVQIHGTGRQVVMGAIPEAVWTEMCATLNELDLSFNDVEVDGYKVGGYFSVCNAALEDNDVELASRIVEALGEGIAVALDKAILYGTGTKMPLGIVTRLAQTAKPSDYSATEREWVDLSDHIITGTGKSDTALFKEILTNSSKVKNDYFNGARVWVMNESTYNTLLVESMGKNSSAAIVAGMNSTMPIFGGSIVLVPFVPDGDIIVGYPKAYLLAERAGVKLAQSEHAKFIEDRTVFRGTARYDGKPVIAEAFAVMSIGTTAPTTTVEFAADKANASA